MSPIAQAITPMPSSRQARRSSSRGRSAADDAADACQQEHAVVDEGLEERVGAGAAPPGLQLHRLGGEEHEREREQEPPPGQPEGERTKSDHEPFIGRTGLSV